MATALGNADAMVDVPLPGPFEGKYGFDYFLGMVFRFYVDGTLDVGIKGHFMAAAGGTDYEERRANFGIEGRMKLIVEF